MSKDNTQKVFWVKIGKIYIFLNKSNKTAEVNLQILIGKNIVVDSAQILIDTRSQTMKLWFY